MADSNNGLNNSGVVELSGKILVVAIIVLFMVVAFILFLHLYLKWSRLFADEPPVPVRHRRRRRFDFVPGQEAAARRGLDHSVLQALPVVIFRADEFKEGLECAVCLSELAEGEKARLLPKCNHGFHVDCIDMWFKSHSTCPLCRNPISGGPEVSNAANVDPVSVESMQLSSSSSSSYRSAEESSEIPTFPPNILFWGDGSRVNSRSACLEEGTSSTSAPTSEGMIVIDIPRQAIENRPPSVSPNTSDCALEDMKSPVVSRLRSFKRLMSWERKSGPTTSGDIEQAITQSQPRSMS